VALGALIFNLEQIPVRALLKGEDENVVAGLANQADFPGDVLDADAPSRSEGIVLLKVLGRKNARSRKQDQKRRAATKYTPVHELSSPLQTPFRA
jgi:hypothetical protein